MSAKKLKPTAATGASSQSTAHLLNLSPGTYQVRRNGLEFQSRQAIAEWTEMTVQLEEPGTSRSLNCSGVVVSCQPTAAGYQIAMVFTGMTQQVRSELDTHFFQRPPARATAS